MTVLRTLWSRTRSTTMSWSSCRRLVVGLRRPRLGRAFEDVIGPVAATATVGSSRRDPTSTGRARNGSISAPRPPAQISSVGSAGSLRFRNRSSPDEAQTALDGSRRWLLLSCARVCRRPVESSARVVSRSSPRPLRSPWRASNHARGSCSVLPRRGERKTTGPQPQPVPGSPRLPTRPPPVRPPEPQEAQQDPSREATERRQASCLRTAPAKGAGAAAAPGQISIWVPSSTTRSGGMR